MNKLAKFVRTPMFKGKYDANEDDAVEAYHLLNKYVFDNVLNQSCIITPLYKVAFQLIRIIRLIESQ